MMTEEFAPESYINEINRIRRSLNLKEYDAEYLNSLSPEELKRLCSQQAALTETAAGGKKFNKKLLAIPVIVAVLILLAVCLIISAGNTSAPLPSGAARTRLPDLVEPGTNVIACDCDIKPDLCDYTECYCDPLCPAYN